jgi:hypothetical protein
METIILIIFITFVILSFIVIVGTIIYFSIPPTKYCELCGVKMKTITYIHYGSPYNDEVATNYYCPSKTCINNRAKYD